MPLQVEREIALEILKKVRRLQLPLKLDELTEGRGNCFPLAVLAQCSREEIFQDLDSSTQNLVQQNYPTLLRREVYSFVATSRNQKINELKKRYGEVLSVVDNKSWREY